MQYLQRAEASLTRTSAPVVLPWALTIAMAVPSLLAYNVPPSATLLNQAAALLGWGGCHAVLVVALRDSPARNATRPDEPARCALGALIAAALARRLWTDQPWGLALSNAGMLGATVVLALCGAAAHRAGTASSLFAPSAGPAGRRACSACAVGLVQVFAPRLADGDWIALAPGRPRDRQPAPAEPPEQPAAVVGGRRDLARRSEGRCARSVAATLFALMVFGVVLSASRTGHGRHAAARAVGPARPPPVARHAALLLCVAAAVRAQLVGARGSGRTRPTGVRRRERGSQPEGASATTRFAIWSNTLALIAQHPWPGVGFGEFNFAWTLTPFPDRPVEFFDHTHNLPLHLAVELGVPLAVVVLGAAGFRAVARVRGVARPQKDAKRRRLRAAFVMVLMMALHSLLEYPLWYAYFLLPTALAFGLCLGRAPGRGADAAHRVPAGRTRPLLRRGDARDRSAASPWCSTTCASSRSSRRRRTPRRWPSASPRASGAGSSRTMPTTRRRPSPSIPPK